MLASSLDVIEKRIDEARIKRTTQCLLERKNSGVSFNIYWQSFLEPIIIRQEQTHPMYNHH